MKETIRLYADFALAMTCACIAIVCEYSAQALLYASHWLSGRADYLSAFALRISGVTEVGIED